MKSALAFDKDSFELFEGFEDDEEEGIDNGAEFDWEMGDFDAELTEFEGDEEVKGRRGRSGAPGSRGKSTLFSRQRPGSRGRTRFARPRRRRRPRRAFRRIFPALALRRRRLTVGFPPEETLQGAEYIRWVQASLNRVLALRLPVNGILGPETRSAVRRFQERERLPVTGIVGPDTERALIAALAGVAPAEPAGVAPAEPARVAPAEPAEPEPSDGELDDLEFDGDFETEYGEEEENNSLEVRELNPALVDLAEKIFAREAPFAEGEVEGEVASRWTRCFSNQDIEKVITAYKDNAKAAGANRNDRCSCIVMLNVALGQLLSLRLKEHPARGRPPTRRRVQMGDLPTGSIEEAMQQLRRKGFAVSPWVTSFFDRRKRTAGTLKPEELKASVQAKVLAAAQTKGCWFAFALSVLNGYHSVLLLVDHTAVLPSGASAPAKIFWLDQFSTGRWMDADVTNSLDQRLKEKTQAFWDAFRKTRIEECVKRGRSRADCTRRAARSDTTIRLWQLKKRR